MKTKMRRSVALLTVLVLIVTLLSGCGGKSGKNEPAEDVDFLLGAWFAKTASANGKTVDADDVFGGTFMLYFSDDHKCTMSIDQNRALVDWELTDNGVTLKGDDTYEATFKDQSRKTMVVVIKGVDVLMEKYEDETD